MSRATAQREDGLVAAPQQRVAGSQSPPGLTSPLSRASNRTDTLCRTSSLPPARSQASKSGHTGMSRASHRHLIGARGESPSPQPPSLNRGHQHSVTPAQLPRSQRWVTGYQEDRKEERQTTGTLLGFVPVRVRTVRWELHSHRGANREGGKSTVKCYHVFFSWQDGPEQNVFGSLLAPD